MRPQLNMRFAHWGNPHSAAPYQREHCSGPPDRLV